MSRYSKSLPLILVCAAAILACERARSSDNAATSSQSPQQIAAAPTFSVASGTYTSLQSVQLADATTGATIYYTTDGSAPTTSSARYTAPIPLATTTTIEAIAAAAGYSNSGAAQATYTINLPPAPAICPISDVHQGFIYQIVTDRFFNGDPTNDNPPQSAGLFDPNGFTNPSDWHLYWGGDLAGIQQKLGYLKSMGVAAIWISPPLDNINANAGASNGETGYHGYWPRDMKLIEEHFGNGSNSWTAFDSLAAAAHANGIKVFVDFVANHTNPIGAGENGSLYDSGTKVTDYSSDTSAVLYYHHNSNIADYNDRYQIQYFTLDGLADLDQMNPWVDQYLKASVTQFLAHGADGFRFDAIKDVNWGWTYSLENTVANWSGASSLPASTARPFLFGEWDEGAGDPLYPDSVKYFNNSGMNLLDYPLYYPLADVFGSNKSFYEIDNELTLETAGSSASAGFVQPNDLVTFFDNHDNARIMTLGADRMAMKLALSFLLTCRGVPTLYYGDEQYLHNDNGGGTDPYNRNAMTSFSPNDATLLVQYLAALRAANPAVAYGSMRQRWVNDDIYIYERVLGTNIVLIAINKNPSTDQPVTGLYTYLPPGSYTDYLAQTMGGVAIAVTGTAGSNNPVVNFSLPHRSVSIWISTGSVPPSIGSVTPRVANPGALVAISGAGFGSTQGTVVFSAGSTTATATVNSWSSGKITASVPALAAGQAQVTVTQGQATSKPAPFVVNTSSLIPVDFSVTGAPTMAGSDVLMLTGNVAELGNWATTWSGAIGPVPIPSAGSGLQTVSVPSGSTVQFKFLIRHSDGTLTWESGSNHSYSVPATGVGAVSVNW